MYFLVVEEKIEWYSKRDCSLIAEFLKIPKYEI
jgi:hypothetical protein